MIDVNKFGYPTDKPCEVCGCINNNQLEPRFIYVVCVDHQYVSPVDVSHGAYTKEPNK